MAGLVRLISLAKPSRMRSVHWFGLIGLVIAALLLAAVAIWWGKIRETTMDPGVSYQTYDPPPPPAYDDPAAWALRPTVVGDQAADIFFVHPTTYQGRQWNGPLDDAQALSRLKRLMLPNYAGPFAEVGRVFAPLYRQASLYTQITLREDARDARAYAYGDVKRAFDLYMQRDNGGRPLIIVGVEQGGLIAGRLAREALAEDASLAGRLAGVYLIETAEPAALYGPGAPLPACQRRDEAGCVVAYLATTQGENHLLHERMRHAPQWRGELLVSLGKTPVLCVNPLLGAVSDEAVSTEQNIGAANASGLEWGDQPGFQAHQVGAQCVDGILEVTRSRSTSLRGRENWADSRRVRSYNWFYADLAADAKARVETLMAERPPGPAGSEPAVVQDAPPPLP